MRARDAFSTILLVVCLSACTRKLSPDLESDRVIRSGSHVHITHTLPGGYSAPVLAIANSKLDDFVSRLGSDVQIECVLVPQIAGYDVVILSRRRLTKEEEKKVNEFVDAAVAEAQKEAHIYFDEKKS
ncbi:MAG: hypothetical protein HYV95_13125 [Opitutae bacterium]|nr:hypothetical protein [Opitutae bacterium]